ncbi:MAG: hypothetical protein MI725_02775 [Pirellulales bacterium]|nr:hypothetical protein [Pirellulales bacterium]
MRRKLSAFVCLALIVSWSTCACAVAAEPLFAPPQPPQSITQVDEIVLVSTRAVGTTCDSQKLGQGLRCDRWEIDATGRPAWKMIDWRELLLPSQPDRPTVIYVHGNRVATGRDRTEGLKVYHSLKKHGPPHGPIRFIIWSWPSTPIPRPVKDFRVKAAFTHPVAWQFAWFLDQMPADTHLSLVGYSYGTRVVSGAMHLLEGGRLGELKLHSPPDKERAPIRAALIAAAFDADWIQPGNYYGRTLHHLECLVLTTNKQDPAMRFYHLSNGHGRVHALGRTGIEKPRLLGTSARRIKQVDFTDRVGRNHALAEYLAASGKMSTVWRQILPPGEKRTTEKIASLLQRLPWLK